MKIELTTDEAKQLIKEHLGGTSNFIEVVIVPSDENPTVKVTACELNKQSELVNKRRELVTAVKQAMDINNTRSAITFVLEAIPYIGLKNARVFVQMSDAGFDLYISTGLLSDKVNKN